MTNFSPSLRFWEGVQGDPAISGAWGSPLSLNFTIIDNAITGVTPIAIGGLATFPLSTSNGSPDQARSAVLLFTGALTGACTVTLPNVTKIGYVQNQTTGGQNVILTSGAGTTVAIANDGQWHLYYADGNANVSLPLLSQNTTTISGATLAVTGNGSIGGTFRVTGATTLAAVTATSLSVNGAAAVTNNSGTYGINITGNAGHATNATNATSSITSGTAANLLGGSVQATTGSFSGALTGSTGFFSGAVAALSFNTTSDARMKIDDGLIEPDSAWRYIKRIRPRWFRWKTAPDEASQPGFFAQQVHRVFPWGASKKTKTLPWSINSPTMMPLVIVALQNALARIEALEKGK